MFDDFFDDESDNDEHSHFVMNGSKTVITDYFGKEKRVVIPASVRMIKAMAFSASSIEHVSLEPGSNLTKIDEYAFYRCDHLKSVDLSNAKNKIHIFEGAFRECSALEDILGWEKIKEIDIGAFASANNIFIYEGEFMYPRLWLYNLLVNGDDWGCCCFDLFNTEQYSHDKILSATSIGHYSLSEDWAYVTDCKIPIAADVGYKETIFACISEDPESVEARWEDTERFRNEMRIPTRESVGYFLDELNIQVREPLVICTSEERYRQAQRELLQTVKERSQKTIAKRVAEGGSEILDFDFSKPITQKCRKCVTVYLLDGDRYKYNSELDVKRGSLVYVTGKKRYCMGIVEEIVGHWSNQPYMQEIVKAFETPDDQEIYSEDQYQYLHFGSVYDCALHRSEDDEYDDDEYDDEEYDDEEYDDEEYDDDEYDDEEEHECVREKRCKVRVKFSDGKSHLYNSAIPVEVGDCVRVEGKYSESIGTIISIEGDWSPSPYMMKITEVVSEDDSKESEPKLRPIVLDDDYPFGYEKSEEMVAAINSARKNDIDAIKKLISIYSDEKNVLNNQKKTSYWESRLQQIQND